MANKLEVEVTGINDLLRIFQALPEKMKQAARAEMSAIGAEAVEQIRLNAPILSGDLRADIGIDVIIEGDQISMIATDNMDYALIRHEGYYNLGPISRQQPDTPEGGVGRKYMERVFNYHILEWQQRIANAIMNS